MTGFGRFMWNGLFLCLSSLAMRGIGVLFNLYLTRVLGGAGLGRFSLIMTVYGLFITFCTSGIHLAVTRVAAEEAAVGHTRGVRFSVGAAGVYSLCFGALSSALLFVTAPFLAEHFLGGAEAAPILRLLSLSLLPCAVSTALGGGFVAMQCAYRGAIVSVMTQVVRVSATVCLLRALGTDRAVWAMAWGSVLSEYAALLLSLLLLRLPGARGTPLDRGERRHLTLYLLRIALPIAVTTYIRSGLMTVEHLLIPGALQASGLDREAALSAYGTVHGTVLPVVLFPAALVISFAGLIIPEIARLRTRGQREVLCRQAVRVLRLTLLFALFVAGAMMCWSEELSLVLYRSTEAAHYIRRLAALVPVMYLDTAVDGLLKGLDAQVASMRYNIMDAALCVVLACVLLPTMGIDGYVLLLYASESFNLALSLGKLLSLTEVSLSPLRHLGLPLLCVILSASLSSLLARLLGAVGIAFRVRAVSLVFHMLSMLVIYYALLRLTGCVTHKNLLHVRSMLSGDLKKKEKCGIIVKTHEAEARGPGSGSETAHHAARTVPLTRKKEKQPYEHSGKYGSDPCRGTGGLGRPKQSPVEGAGKQI